MNRMSGGVAAEPARFTLGEWLVDVPSRRLLHGDDSVVLEPLPMAVLAEMCRRPHEVISTGALLEACWPGEVLGDNPVHKVVAGLRRALQDSATAPQYIETIRKRGYRMVAPIGVLSEQGPRSHEGGWRSQSPFRGLASFGAEHASIFFGRDGAVAALHARLGAQWRRGHPLVVLLGPSGSGKTSLVQAGALPALLLRPAKSSTVLQACTAGTVDLATPSEQDAWLALAGAMLDWDCGGVPLLAGHSIDSLARALREECDVVLRLLRIGLDACGAMQRDGTLHTPPLLVLDRLEALFQPSAQAHAAAVIECIDCLVRSRLVLLLAICRNDFYPSLARHPVLIRDKEHGAHMDLAPPGAEAIAQMIRLPARAAGLVYGRDASGMNRLDDRLCADAMHAPDALPLLQYTLQELYLNRAPGGMLSWAAYEALGGLEGAIGRRAEAIVAGLPSAQQDSLDRLLPRLVSLAGEDAAPTSRWVTATELDSDDERALARALVDARLLVADHVGGTTGYRVVHEALLRRWPRVTAWVAQHRASLALRDQLVPWVRRWLDGGHASPLLLPRGAMLWQAGRVLAQAPSLFGDEEREFVTRSQARVRWQARWRWAAVLGALGLAAAAVAAAIGYAQLARVASERERQSQRLASFMLGDLADRLRPIGKLDLLDSIGEQGLKLLSHGDEGAETALDVLQRAKALLVLGEVNSSRGRGRSDLALEALGAARRLLEPLEHSRDIAPGDYYKALGATAFWLGQIAFDAGDFDNATHEMLRYRDACERWQRVAPSDAAAKAELGFAVNSLGSIALRRGDWSEADRWFELSLALKTSVLAEHPQDADALDAVASSRTWLGLVAYVRGQPTRALALYDAARAVQAQMLARRPDEVVRLWDLGTLDVRRGETLRALGRPADALRVMSNAVARLQQAERNDPSNRRWRLERVHAESGLLLARLDAGAPVEEGVQQLREQVARPVSDDPGNSALRRETLARAAALEAELAARGTDLHDALRRTEAAQRKVRELLGVQPLHWQGRELQARLALLDMRVHAALGRPGEQAGVCAGARNELQPAIDAGQAGLVLEAWIAASACASSRQPEDGWLQRLSSGGYQPVHAAFIQPHQGETQ